MHKFIRTLLIVIVGVFSLAVFGWMSVHISKGDQDFGFLNDPARYLYSFLDQFNESVDEVQKLSPTFLPIWSEVKTVNKLQDNLNILTSYSEMNNSRKVAIRNLKRNSIIYKWDIPEKVSQWDCVVNPYAFPNNDLVYFFTDRFDLLRIDSTGNYKCKQDAINAHHALTLESTGNFWACTKNAPKSPEGTYKITGRTVFYDDDYITNVDANTGEILFHKSATEILRTNELASNLLQAQPAQDQIHLNDVEPAWKTTKYYKEDDVFLSTKQSSILLHYSPSENEVSNIMKARSQHEIDFYNDSMISIFKNNSYAWWTTENQPEPESTDHVVNAGNFYPNIVLYNLRTTEFTVMGYEVFRQKELFTSTEGLHEFINDSTYLVDQQNVRYTWDIQNDKVLYKDILNSPYEAYCHLDNLARVMK